MCLLGATNKCSLLVVRSKNAPRAPQDGDCRGVGARTSAAACARRVWRAVRCRPRAPRELRENEHTALACASRRVRPGAESWPNPPASPPPAAPCSGFATSPRRFRTRAATRPIPGTLPFSSCANSSPLVMVPFGRRSYGFGCTSTRPTLAYTASMAGDGARLWGGGASGVRKQRCGGCHGRLDDTAVPRRRFSWPPDAPAPIHATHRAAHGEGALKGARGGKTRTRSAPRPRGRRIGGVGVGPSLDRAQFFCHMPTAPRPTADPCMGGRRHSKKARRVGSKKMPPPCPNTRVTT